jgi:hypothetical protein
VDIQGNMSMKPHDLERFFSKLFFAPNGCWEWQGRLNGHGYGIFVLGHATAFLAHRIIYECFYGAIPRGMCVLHSCDNRKCVNPWHLRAGTQADNVKDMMDRGRNKCVPLHGARNPQAKLSSEEVKQIREMYVPRKTTLKMISNKFGVCEATISMIINRKRWPSLA